MKYTIDTEVPKDLIKKRAESKKGVLGLTGLGLVGLLGLGALNNDTVAKNTEVGINRALLHYDAYKCMIEHGKASERGQFAHDALRVVRGENPKYFDSVSSFESAISMPFYREGCSSRVGDSYYAVLDSLNGQ